jgi:hypothetical protein
VLTTVMAIVIGSPQSEVMSDTLSLIVFVICVSTCALGLSATRLTVQALEIAIFVPLISGRCRRAGNRLQDARTAVWTRRADTDQERSRLRVLEFLDAVLGVSRSEDRGEESEGLHAVGILEVPGRDFIAICAPSVGLAVAHYFGGAPRDGMGESCAGMADAVASWRSVLKECMP